MVDMAILGILSEGPLHGYELKRRLVDFGFWRISFGSVYPALRRLEKAGHIEKRAGSSGRRKEYAITADGKEYFQATLTDEQSEVENSTAFRVRFALLSHLQPGARIRLLERRKAVLRERAAEWQERLTETAGRIDRYTQSLMEHGISTHEADIAWLDELIEAERGADTKRS